MRCYTLTALAAAAVLSTTTAQADIFKGRKLYSEHCARCHGGDGNSVVPGTPNISRGEGMMAPDQVLLRSLRYGKGLMPGFEAVIRGRELFDVLVYARSLQR